MHTTMKQIAHLIFTIAFLVRASPPASATTPFSPLRATTPSGSYTVELNPGMNNALVVYGTTNAVVSSHSIHDLGFTVRERMDHIHATTAGLDWYYPNALVFFSPDERFCFVHLPWGKTIAFDLDSQRVAAPMTAELAVLVTQRLEAEAIKLLEAGRNDKGRREAVAVALRMTNATERVTAMRALITYGGSRDREAGAMICGNLKLTNAVPKLTALLTDDAYRTIGGRDGWRRVYYVRQAARDALNAMGQSVENIVTEEMIEEPGALNRVQPDAAPKLSDPQH